MTEYDNCELALKKSLALQGWSLVKWPSSARWFTTAPPQRVIQRDGLPDVQRPQRPDRCRQHRRPGRRRPHPPQTPRKAGREAARLAVPGCCPASTSQAGKLPPPAADRRVPSCSWGPCTQPAAAPKIAVPAAGPSSPAKLAPQITSPRTVSSKLARPAAPLTAEQMRKWQHDLITTVFKVTLDVSTISH